jgi:hypothetical protein
VAKIPRLHIHWHHEVEPPGRLHWQLQFVRRMDWYGQCRCGHRTWRPLVTGGYWPVDHAWLNGEGERPWDRPLKPPRQSRH